METVAFLLVATLMALGVALHAITTLGVIRFPDFYARAHAVGMGDTLALGLILTAVAVGELSQHIDLDSVLTAVNLLLIVVFYFIANPSSGHAIGRAALRSRIPCWTLPQDRDKSLLELPDAPR